MKKGLALLLLSLTMTACIPAFWRKPPPPSMVGTDGMPLHQSWCYQTLAEIECYTEPQDVPPGRLVGVNPPIITPLSRSEYAKTLAESR